MYSEREKADKLFRSIHQVLDFYNDYAKRLNLSYYEVMIYCTLLNDEVVTQTQLCEQTGCTKSTINSMVKRSLKKGHMMMMENPENRREKFLMMTEEGKSFAMVHIQPIMELEENAVRLLSDDEVDVGCYVCDKYYELLRIADLSLPREELEDDDFPDPLADFQGDFE